MRAHPRAVGASGVSHVNARADAAKLEVNPAHLRIVEGQVVRRVPTHGRERVRHREGRSSAGPRDRGDPRNGVARTFGSLLAELRAAAALTLDHGPHLTRGPASTGALFR